LKQKINEIDNFDSLVKALYIFQTDKFFTEQLNDKILEMSDKLGPKEWLTLMNAKSILRQRNQLILEACTYNLNKSLEHFKLEDIKTCFLSFGILSYYDSLLVKRLMKDLTSFIEDPKNIAMNESRFNTLNAIVLSLGMLRLRDPNLIEKLSEFLNKQLISISDKENLDGYDAMNVHQLIINFIISCAHLNLAPETEVFDKLIKHLNLRHFNVDKVKSKSQLISLTWSLCVLDKVKPEFVKYVLSEEFYTAFLECNNFKKKLRMVFDIELCYILYFSDSSHKEFIPSFMKLLQVNLYSVTSIPNYQGPNLPPEVNILEYQNVKRIF
jgi:hypothetical protein